jgi:hypothetical protein
MSKREVTIDVRVELDEETGPTFGVNRVAFGGGPWICAEEFSVRTLAAILFATIHAEPLPACAADDEDEDGAPEVPQ